MARRFSHKRWHRHVQARVRTNRIEPQIKAKLARDRKERELAEKAEEDNGQKPKTQ